MRYFILIIFAMLFSACVEEAIEFTESDKNALEGLEIAYQGATEAILELEDAIHDGADEETIHSIDALFHMHYDNYLMYSENYSHSLLTNHYHDSDHGMHMNAGDGHDDGHDEGTEDGHDEGNEDGHDEGNEDGHDEGTEEGHDEGNDDSNHHTRGEHHADDHKDMEHLMEKHNEMDIHH